MFTVPPVQQLVRHLALWCQPLKFLLRERLPMRGFLSIFRMELKIMLANRGGILLGGVHQLMLTGGQILLWLSLLRQGPVVAAGQQISNTTMIQYVLLSTFIWSFAEFRIIDTINDRMSRGHAAIDLLRPVSFPTLIFAHEAARTLFGLLFYSLPVVLIFSLIYGLNLPPFSVAILTFFFAFGGWIISIQMGWCLGILAFWVLETTQVKFALQGVTALFSGALVPLWFFPDSLQKFADWLPFQLLFHAPLSIWLGHSSNSQVLTYFERLIFWIGLFWLMSAISWHQSRQRFVSQGG